MRENNTVKKDNEGGFFNTLKQSLPVLIISMLAGALISTYVFWPHHFSHDSLEQYTESVREVGYYQAYIETAYGMGLGISEDSYNKYLEAKQRYEEDMSSDNFQYLADAINDVLEEKNSSN